MAKIDKLHHDIIEGFKNNSYDINEKQRQLSNLTFELDLLELPLLSIKKIDYFNIVENLLGKIVQIDRIDNVISGFNDLDINIAPCIKIMKDSSDSIFSYEFIRKPIKDFTRIIYASGDKTYLEALWQTANFGKNESKLEAKNLLEKELIDVPKFGFILNVNYSLQDFEIFFENILGNAILAYLVAECTENFIPLSLYIHCSQFRYYKSNYWDQVQTNPHKYSVPYLEFSDNLKEKAGFVKSGDLSFTDFIAYIHHTDIIIKNYRQ